jgi:hypothetical protein
MTRAGFEVDGNAIAAVLKVMSIAFSLRESGAFSSAKRGFGTIFNEYELARQNVDELIFVTVPMSLA